VLLPTRELAQQCYKVTKKLACFTDISCCLIVGGISSKSQHLAMKQNPDIIICTTGRLVGKKNK
jgi:ATP-dependent RNA helicase DDX27